MNVSERILRRLHGWGVERIYGRFMRHAIKGTFQELVHR